MSLPSLLTRRCFQRAAAHARWKSTATGFAGMAAIQQPGDWQRATAEAVAECTELVQRVVITPPSAATVQLLDDISDTLCQVLDAAEFCRNVHAAPEWRAAAQQTCIDLGTYVHDLNTHYGIYSALVHALDGHARRAAAAQGRAGGGAPPRRRRWAAWLHAGGAGARGEGSGEGSGASSSGGQLEDGFCEETVLVGRMLRRDFERYGVHLDGEARDRIGFQFTQNILDPAQYGEMEVDYYSQSAALQRLPHSVQRKLLPVVDSGSGRVRGLAVPGDSHLLNAIMSHSSDEGLRRQAFMAYHQQPASNAKLLDRLVLGRHEIARIMGHESYAAYQLDGFSLAGHPGAVSAFLQRLAAELSPRAAAEAAALRALKQRLARAGLETGGGGAAAGVEHIASSSSSSPGLAPWDRGYLLGLARAEAAQADLTVLPQHFQLDHVVEGLGRLTRRLMGVALEEVPLQPGEGWAPGVRRLEASHEEEGFLGTIYLDLYRRPHKFPSAAHFTLRCGRARPGGGYQARRERAHHAGPGRRRRLGAPTPVVALVAGFHPGAGLAHCEVETLTHEFGHALNSLLSRTHFQHLSGTRGPHDMVEVPSHMLELFASQPRILADFLASPDASGRPVPAAALEEVAASKHRFSALEFEQQLLYASLDQLLHGPAPPTGPAAVAAAAALGAAHSSFGSPPPGVLPHLRFTHIVGYGGHYYSYLYAQALAAQLWQRHLAADPLGRAAGERLRRALLEPGGAREARALVARLFALDGGAPDAGAPPVLWDAGGGWCPDPSALLLAY
eukprot:scaffold1.g5743.t1